MPELPEFEILIDLAWLMVVLLVTCVAVGFFSVAVTKGMLCCKHCKQRQTGRPDAERFIEHKR